MFMFLTWNLILDKCRTNGVDVTFQVTAVSGLHLLFPTISYLPSTEEVADPVNDEVAVHVEDGHAGWSIEHRHDNSLASADEWHAPSITTTLTSGCDRTSWTQPSGSALMLSSSSGFERSWTWHPRDSIHSKNVKWTSSLQEELGSRSCKKKTKILFLRTKSCFVTIDNAFKTISSNHQLEKTNL